jgi:protein-disulfide isomerase
MPPVPTPSAPEKRGGNRTTLIAVAVAGLIAAVLIGASIVLTRDNGGESASPTTAPGPSETAPASTETGTTAAPSVIAGLPQNGTVLGDPQAQVRMLQFEDIQCPFCKKYTDDVFPALVAEYVKPGRVKIDFRGLAFLGPDSEKALRIVVASGFQDKLWDVVELLYANQGEENSGWVTDAKIDEILSQVPGLDAAKVKADAKTAAVTKEIAAVQAEAAGLQVQGTPSFFIGFGLNQPSAFQPTSLTPGSFRPALDEVLQGS